MTWDDIQVENRGINGAGVLRASEWNTMVADQKKRGSGFTTVVGKSLPCGFLTTDYSSDNLCIQAAIDYVYSIGGGCILIKAGEYTISTSLEPKSNINIVGVGAATILKYDGGSIVPENSQNHFFTTSELINFSIENIKFTQNETDNKCYAAFYCHNGNNIHIKNCTFINLKNATAIIFFNTKNLTYSSVEGCYFETTGITKAQHRSIYFDASCYCSSINNTINNISLNAVSDVRGIEFDDISTVGVVDIGFHNKAIGNTVLGFSKYGIMVEGQDNCIVSNNSLEGGDGSQGRGIYVTGSSRFVNISNNVLKNMAGQGIHVGTYAYDDQTLFGRVVVDGNILYNCNSGINLNSNADYCIVSNNVIKDTVGNALWLTDDGASNVPDNCIIKGNSVESTTYNIYWEDVACSGCLVEGNIFSKKPTQLSTGTIAVNNVGYNPRGSITTPAMPASTVNYKNVAGCPCQVIIYGGTVTGIDLDDVPTSLTSGSFVVGAGETINITYSVAPSWLWWGL
jgi:hypothetical protein